MTTITSPVEGFTGTTTFGPLAVTFEDGKATVDNLPDGIRDYLLGAGYKVGSKQRSAVVTLDGNTVVEQPVDSRVLEHPQIVGTPLRDAAVDPRPEDFLAPTNAGLADPHGPEVVSPEVHASEGTRPVKPGDVHVDDTDAQDDAETEHAADATDGTPIDDGPEPPAGNASREDWAAYATALGQDPGDRGRDELRETYGPKAEA